MLIEETLRIPCRMTQGCFRFLCPVCNGFNTAVNHQTNLARCFDCSKNFNTIDLVMLCRQAKFVDSVKFLQSIHQKQSACPDNDPIRRNTSQESSGPCQIGQIIADILPTSNADSPCQSNPDNPIVPHRAIDENRIAKLEHQLELLGRQIQELTRTMNTVPPAK